MCCTIEPATLTNTKIYAAEVQHPTEGLVHVIGYQNEAFSIPGRPNAMLLPIPAVPGTVSQANLVNTETFKGILNKYNDAVTRLEPTLRSFSRSLGDVDGLTNYGAKGFTIFESGSYTVVLASSGKYLSDGAKEVPEAKRVVIPQTFADGLEAMYPNWPIALCCFVGAVEKAEPILWWYKPSNPEELLAPGIDAHDGGLPNLTKDVQRDHTLAFASSESDRDDDRILRTFIDTSVPAEHRWMFSAKVCGVKLTYETQNGDFTLPVSRIRSKAAGDAHLVEMF